MSRLRRRRVAEQPEMDFTAFMNLMVALIPFLLATAVFVPVHWLDLNVPTGTATTVTDLPPKVVVNVRPTQLLITTPQGKQVPLQRPAQPSGYSAVNQYMQQLKLANATVTHTLLLLPPDIHYGELVALIDAVRGAQTTSGTEALFPDLAFGDTAVEKSKP